jgi:hypothetical protein
MSEAKEAEGGGGVSQAMAMKLTVETEEAGVGTEARGSANSINKGPLLDIIEQLLSLQEPAEAD